MKNRIIGYVLFLTFVACIVVAYIFWTPSNEKKDGTKEEPTSANVAIDIEMQKATEENAEILEEKTTTRVEVEKDETDLIENYYEINGYRPKKIYIKEKMTEQQTTTNEEDAKENDKCVLTDANIVVESVGTYTGEYIEDGSDVIVNNVAALIVNNQSDKMLQLGIITFNVKQGENATFQITNLLPGAAVLVLEQNKREYNQDDDYSYGDIATAYLDNASLAEEYFEIIENDGELTLKNKTDNTYNKVYVYYKHSQTDGIYMGGITYRVPFDEVGAKGSVKSIANHFVKGKSKIIDIQVLE